METIPLSVRIAEVGDAPALAVLHAAAWRQAYRGIIDGLTLERMVARRGPRWWARAVRGRRVMVLIWDAEIAGYAAFGAARTGGGGEIFEIYLAAEYQGAGFGARLFRATRRALARAGHGRLVVWSLVENEAACRFYRAMGGRPGLRASQRVGEQSMPTIGFLWERGA